MVAIEKKLCYTNRACKNTHISGERGVVPETVTADDERYGGKTKEDISMSVISMKQLLEAGARAGILEKLVFKKMEP